MRSRIAKIMLDKSKLQIFSTILVALVIFVLYVDGILFSYFRDGAPNFSMVHPTKYSFSTTANIRLLSIKEELTNRKKLINPFIPPFNISEGERIAWLQRKLPKLEIFVSDLLTKQFHSRVLQFLNSDCQVRVFMTWISPASTFGRREILALASLFRQHPKGCLVILSRTLDSMKGYTILKPLIDRRFKVHAVTPDLSFLFKDTPAESWLDDIKKGNRDPGEISLAQNLSNVMRLAVLYKYGGIYLDTDFIVLKPLTGLRNSIGAQSMDLSRNWTRLNNAVLIFDMNHPLLLNFIEEFASTFDGSRWGHNGPYLVSRVVRKVGSGPGFNFIVLPPVAFYPVDWTKIGGLFKRPESEAQLRWVKAKLLQLSTGEAYGVHLWNRQSSGLLIEEGSVLGRLISDHCVTCEDINGS